PLPAARRRERRPRRPGARSRARTGTRASACRRCTACATAPTVAPLIYVLLMLVVTAVWGWTFVLVKDAVTQYLTLPFLQIRFVLALIVIAAVVHRLPTRRELRVGAIVGIVLAAGYLAQTVGLTITSPGNAGLITGLFVVLTPVI